MKSNTMKHLVAMVSVVAGSETVACSGADMPEVSDLEGGERNVATVQAALRPITARQDLKYDGTPNATSSACTSNSRDLAVFEPTNPAPDEKFPIFIYAGGLGASHLAPDAIAIAQAAAGRGYIAASMGYANDQLGTCATLNQRADCSYNGTRGASAVRKLCDRPRADCSRGIVLGGGSLGGALSVRAKNFEPRVRAIFTTGTAASPGKAPFLPDTRTCINPGPLDGGSTNRALRNREWRLYAGETEFTVNNRINRNASTGTSCLEGEFNCLRPDGSGWFQVRDSEVPDLIADHCYTSNGNGAFPAGPGVGIFIGEDPDVVQSCGSPQVNSTFLNEQRIWSVGPTIDFLTSRIDPQGCDQGRTGLDQANLGRLSVESFPFFEGTLLTVVTVTGSPASTVALIVTAQQGFDAVVTVSLQLQAIPVSLAETAPNVFQLCQAINFPVGRSCNAQGVCTPISL
jgi:hypothetical protein